MQRLKVGKSYMIHSYKHNGVIYKAWDHAIFLDYIKKYEVYVFVNDCARVMEIDGRSWSTREPAILFFYKDHWYNVIAQCKESGITYYCNLASPVLIEEGANKYIDYDLDVKVFKDGGFKILDRKEYNYHMKKMQYPPLLNQVVYEELDDLIKKVRAKEECFSKELVNKYYEIYLEMKKNNKIIKK